MPQIISPRGSEGFGWIFRPPVPPKQFSKYTGVGEPPEYSLDLDQLQNILITGSPHLIGLQREYITSKRQERESLRERSKDASLSDFQTLQIEKQIQGIDGLIGDPGKEFSDSDIVNMIIGSEPDLQRKLKAFVPEQYGKPGSPLAALQKSMSMFFKDLPSKVTPFLTSMARDMTLPKTPYQRRMYEVGRNMELQRAEKAREMLKTSDRDDNPGLYDELEKELAEVDDYLAKHPEWKDEKRYPPKESFTPFELKFEDAMLEVEAAARRDLEKVSLMDTETLAYYKWVKQQNMRDFMDSRGFNASTFMHHLGQGLASYTPAAVAGIAVGSRYGPIAGLTVGRTVMGVMEGSDQYNQAMEYAQENGLDIEEARSLALGTGVTYAVGSAWLEGIAPGMMMRKLGLMVDKPVKSILRRNLFGRINKNAVGKYAAAKSISGKALNKIPFFLQSAGVEGLQELSQYLYQVGIQADYMDEAGDNYYDRYMNIYDVSEAATSAYAGAVTGGVLGVPAGLLAKPGAKAEKAVSAAEAEKKKLEAKVEPIVPELPTGEVEYGKNKTQDYLIRLSDVKKPQLSPESVEEGASPLDISIYEKKGAKSSVDKLFGLIERVGVSAVKEISGLSDDDKSGLLELVRGKVNQETPEVNLTTDEDALKFLNAFAQGGKRVETTKRVDLGAPQVVVETKFDPKGMPVSAQKDIADLGFPTTMFVSPPKIPTVAPAIPEAPLEEPVEPVVTKEPPIVEKIPEPKEPTLEQISKMAAKKKAKVDIEKVKPPYKGAVALEINVDGKNVGKISGKITKKGIEIGAVDVKKEHRGKGYASKLYEAIQAETDGVIYSRSSQQSPESNRIWEGWVKSGKAKKQKSKSGQEWIYSLLKEPVVKAPPVKPPAVVKPELDTAEDEIENLLMGYRAPGMEISEENEINYKREKKEIIDSYLEADLAQLDITYRQKTRLGEEQEDIIDHERHKQETIDYYKGLEARYPYTMAVEAPAERPRISATEGVDVMRGSKWGNPFIVPNVYNKSSAYYKKKGFIKAKSREDAIQSYEDWIRGTAHKDFLPERRAAIIAGLTSGELKGKTLKYFKPDARDSHAVRLAKLVVEQESLPPAVPAVVKPTKVTKIISGGQIGADEFGLEVGKELGIETGGTAPPEFQTSDGKQPEKLKGYGLVAGAKDPKVYRKRTIKNVKDADGTVIFGDLDSPGSKLTVNSAKANKKPYITNPTATELSDWIDKNNIKTLNVAGNRNIESFLVKPILKEALGIQPPAVKAVKPTKKEYWQLTISEFREQKIGKPENIHYQNAAISKLHIAIGVKISADVPGGLVNPQKVADYYGKKYNLGDIPLIPSQKMVDMDAEAAMAISDGNYVILVNPKLLENPDHETLGIIRHEIEHIKDVKEGFKASMTWKHSEIQDAIKGGMSAAKAIAYGRKGHHKYYDLFEADYLHRASVRKALKEGKPVPESVLKDYPDLLRIKPPTKEAPPVVKPHVTLPSGTVKQVKAEKPTGTATKGIKDIKFKVKDEDKIYAAQDNWPTIAEEPELYDKILKRLVKRLPFVKPGLLVDGLKLSFERDKEFRPFQIFRIFGQSIGMSVQWLKEAAPIDTPPHEFFHSYFRLLEKTPIGKLAINKFKNVPEVIKLLENNKLYPDIQTIDHAVEEYLAGHIGEMYVERVRAGIPAKVKAWFKRFWLTLKKMFKPSSLTAKDIMQIIFEEFYRGIVPGMTAKEAAEAAEIIEAEGIPKYKTYNESEQYVDQPSEDGADEGNELSIDYRAASLVHFESYFSKAFGRHINREHHSDMVYFAKINKEVGFGQFFNEIKEWANEVLLDKDGVGVDLDKEYTREEKNYLIQFFLRANSSIKVFDLMTDENGVNKRMYFDAFYYRDANDWKFNWSESEELGNNQNNRRKRPGWKTTNFVEDQGLERVIHLPLNNIVEITPNDNYDSDLAKKAEEEGVPYTVEKEFVFPSNFKVDGGVIMQWNIEFANDFETGKSKNLLFIAGAKGGGGGEIFIGDVHEEHRNMTQQQFLDYLNGEVDKGFMTNAQATSSIVGAVRYTESNPQIYSQIVGRHNWMKNIKGSNYLLRKYKGKTSNIREHFNRLRTDFSEGTIPYGLGDTRIMLFEPDEITLKIDGKNVPLKVFAGAYAFDGWLMSSGDFFRNLANTIGRKPSMQGNKLYETKTVIRHLSDDLVDYLGLKMMQMTPYEGMEFFKDGEKFAEVKVRRGTTVFIDNNNVEFHHLGSTEEAKVIAGKYDRDKAHGGLSDEDGFYKLHTLDEKHIKVLFVPSEFSKKKSAYPIAEGELTLDPALVDNPDYIKFIDALTNHYKDVGKDYLNTLFQMHSDPKMLRKEIYRELMSGEMPTEIQEHLDNFGESGEGIHLPYLISIILPILNNRFINNGLYKVRQRGEDGTGGLSTILVLKPIADLTVGKNGFGVSANNQTVFNRLQKLILEDAETRIMGLVAGDDVESVEAAVAAWYNLPRDERIGMMNNFLKAKPMYAKLSRQPVTGPAVTIMRRISKIVDGYHADVAFLRPEDVAIIQGDFDGDKIGVEMFDNKQIENAFVAWQKTDAYKNRAKTAYISIFKLVKKKTIMTDYSDFLKSMEDLSVAANSQGLVTNSKVIGNILAYKEVKIRLKDPKGKLSEDVYFEAKTPSELVTMDYAPLDKESLMENDFELLKLLEAQGDEVVAFAGGLYREKITSDNIGDVDAKSSLYLKTTHEHEMTNLLQMAVDDVKIPLLSKIGYNSRFMLERMFKRVGDGGPIGQFAPKGINHALAQLRQVFNYSPVRRGLVGGVQSTIQQNIGMSRNINNFINAKNIVKTTMIKGELNARSKKGHRYEGFEVTSVTMNDRIAPVEELLSLLAKEIMTRVDESTDSQFNSEWGGAPGVYSYDVYKTAHVNAMKEMESRWSDIASINNVTEQEMAKGVALMKKISKDFFKIYSDVKKSTPGKVVRLKPEYNEPLRNLIDDYIDDWNKLSDNSQMYATLYFLAGTPTRDKSGKPVKRVNVMKLLPISLMHKPMVKSFAKVWWNMMTKSINSKFKQPKDTRGEMYKGLKFGEAVELSKKIADRFCG